MRLMHDTDAPGIPRRLLLRMAADILDGQVGRLRLLTDARRMDRRGQEAQDARDAKATARKRAIAKLSREADTLRRWAADVKGPDIDAAAAGYLLAWCAGHALGLSEAREELRSLDLDDRPLDVPGNQYAYGLGCLCGLPAVPVE